MTRYVIEGEEQVKVKLLQERNGSVHLLAGDWIIATLDFSGKLYLAKNIPSNNNARVKVDNQGRIELAS